MTIRRITRASNRTPEETARLRADQPGASSKRYQRDKPTVEQLLAEGGHQDTVPLGEFLDSKRKEKS